MTLLCVSYSMPTGVYTIYMRSCVNKPEGVARGFINTLLSVNSGLQTTSLARPAFIQALPRKSILVIDPWSDSTVKENFMIVQRPKVILQETKKILQAWQAGDLLMN